MRASRSIAAALFGALALAAIPAAAAPFELIPNGGTDAGWTTSTETGAGFITFVPAGTSVTSVLGFPIVPHGIPFWVFEQIGPDVQRLSTALAPLPPDVAAGSLLPALFSVDVSVDNYGDIPQGLTFALRSEGPVGPVEKLLAFVVDPPGTSKPHAPMHMAAPFSVIAGEPMTLVITSVTIPFPNIDTVAPRAQVELAPVPEPSSLALALTSLAGVLLAAILVQCRLRPGAAQRSDATKQT
jgi:hypothetical protein